MSGQRTDWIEFVPVWEDEIVGPEITIEIVDSEPVATSRRPRGRFVSVLAALVGLAIGAVIALVGVGDGVVTLPGGHDVPAGVLVGVGIGFAFLQAIVLALAAARRSG